MKLQDSVLRQERNLILNSEKLQAQGYEREAHAWNGREFYSEI
jgi:hypothetical protein